VSGSSAVAANLVGVVGDISGASNITATNGLRTKIRPIADPYADVVPPTKPSCDNKKYVVNANGKTETLDPGCYSGNITINAGATLNLNPGIYYLDGANLNLAGNATITGTGVGHRHHRQQCQRNFDRAKLRTNPRHRSLWRPQDAGRHAFQSHRRWHAEFRWCRLPAKGQPEL